MSKPGALPVVQALQFTIINRYSTESDYNTQHLFRIYTVPLVQSFRSSGSCRPILLSDVPVLIVLLVVYKVVQIFYICLQIVQFGRLDWADRLFRSSRSSKSTRSFINIVQILYFCLQIVQSGHLDRPVRSSKSVV